MPLNLKISATCYSEIAAQLEQQGVKINSGMPLTLEKGTHFAPPYDYRMIAIRRDVMTEASKTYHSPFDDNHSVTNTEHFLNHMNTVLQWVLEGTLPQPAENKDRVEPLATTSKDWK